jgi:hypothetical protein
MVMPPPSEVRSSDVVGLADESSTKNKAHPEESKRVEKRKD